MFWEGRIFLVFHNCTKRYPQNFVFFGGVGLVWGVFFATPCDYLLLNNIGYFLPSLWIANAIDHRATPFSDIYLSFVIHFNRRIVVSGIAGRRLMGILSTAPSLPMLLFLHLYFPQRLRIEPCPRPVDVWLISAGLHVPTSRLCGFRPVFTTCKWTWSSTLADRPVRISGSQRLHPPQRTLLADQGNHRPG